MELRVDGFVMDCFHGGMCVESADEPGRRGGAVVTARAQRLKRRTDLEHAEYMVLRRAIEWVRSGDARLYLRGDKNLHYAVVRFLRARGAI
jgi:hypothetical protein